MNYVIPKLVSRCTFKCVRCWASGNRGETYRLRPGECPEFVDVCPRCGSTDIEVITPEGIQTQRTNDAVEAVNG